jgi:hypothetical protein
MKLSFFVFIWLILSQLAISQTDNSFDEVRALQRENFSQSETLSILELVFKNGHVEYLSSISTSKFMNSQWYLELQKYVAQKKHINFNYRTEMATQAFIINNNEKHLLFADFEKSKVDYKWYVAGAYITKNGREKSIEGYGFTPNDISVNFAKLSKELTTGDGTNLYRQIKNKLPKKYDISPSSEKTVKMSDIIIYNSSSKIEEKIFLTLKYYPAGKPDGYSNKTGWLIDKGGSQHFVLDEPNKDTAYINIPALNNKNIEPNPLPPVVTPKSMNRQSSGNLVKIQCNNDDVGKHLKVTLSWQTGASVPIHSIIMNPDSFLTDRKVVLIGKHDNLKMDLGCTKWLNLSPIISENRELVFNNLTPFNYKFSRSASYLFIYLYY